MHKPFRIYKSKSHKVVSETDSCGDRNPLKPGFLPARAIVHHMLDVKRFQPYSRWSCWGLRKEDNKTKEMFSVLAKSLPLPLSLTHKEQITIFSHIYSTIHKIQQYRCHIYTVWVWHFDLVKVTFSLKVYFPCTFVIILLDRPFLKWTMFNKT